MLVYLTLKQKLELAKETSEIALMLFEVYLLKAGSKKFDYSDLSTAKVMNWTERKVSENRRRLVKSGWFKQKTITDPHTKQTHKFNYMGKKECAELCSVKEAIDSTKRRDYIMKVLKLSDWEEIQGYDLATVIHPLVEEADRLIEAGKL